MTSSVSFSKYRHWKLSDIARVECAQKKKQYPQGATLVALSAVGGSSKPIIYRLEMQGGVDSRYAVVFPKDPETYAPDYLFVSLLSQEETLKKRATGINLQFQELESLCIPVHTEQEMRRYIVRMWRTTSQLESRLERIIDEGKALKQYFLSQMMI